MIQSFTMENHYNKLRSISKTVSAFYENVYAAVLQTLPWIDENGNNLKTATKKVLGNVAFPTYEFSTYKNQKENQETIDRLRARCDELKSIYQRMQEELRPILDEMPSQNRTWEKLQEMVPKWKNMISSDVLPLSMHKAVEQSLDTSVHYTVHDYEAVLGKLLAYKIRLLQNEGKSNHDIAVTFGTHGFWLDRAFLHAMRHVQ